VRRILFLLFACLVISGRSYAQLTLYDGNQNLPMFGGFSGSDLDTVALQNGNLHLHIPIGSWKQRGGTTLNAYFIYDTPTWTRTTTITTINRQRYYITSIDDPTDYWSFVSPLSSYSVSSPRQTSTCPGTGTQVNLWNQYVVTDPEGAKHPLDLQTSGGCIGFSTSSATLDGTGMMVNIGSTPPSLTLRDV
jgi:hypothetical protein